MKNILLWFKVVRPQTLFASICPIMVGLAVSPAINIGIAVVTLLCAIAIQILSNLINDYYDYKRGTDQAGRDGYKRMLAEGSISVRQIGIAIALSQAIAMALGLYLVYTGGWPILIIGISALIFSWLYTATSHSLAYMGVADIFVFIFYGFVSSAGTTYLQTGSLSLVSCHAGCVNGLLSMCVLIINNLRDMQGDQQCGKRTFPVRFGKRAGETGMLIIILLMPLCSYMAFGLNLSMLIAVPELIIFAMVLRAKGKEYNQWLLCTGLTNLLYAISVIIIS